MSKKLVLLAASFVLVAVPARSDDRLAFLIPTLYGPTGLKVDSAALVTNPDGSLSTHSAHFNSQFQAEFTQFNISLAAQLAAIPLPSPASGFTYSLDPGLGVLKRSTQSFGPIYTERADTIGKHKFSVGINYQRFSFDTIEGVDLGEVDAVFTHDNAAPGGRADVVATRNSIDISVDQATALFSLGLLDRLDLSLAVPMVRVDMTVVSNATIYRIGTCPGGVGTTPCSPATHYFANPTVAGGFGNSKSFVQTGRASGIGDLVVRLKGTAIKSGHTGLALGADVRLPTGDENKLLGSGAAAVKPFLAFSFGAGKVAPHLNAGYSWNGKSVLAGNVLTGEKRSLPNEIVFAGGLDWGAAERLTIALDVLGRRVIDSPRLESKTFTALDGHTTLPDIHFVTGSFNIVNGSFGVKFNPMGKLLVALNVLVKLNDAGLRSKVTPFFGVEYSF
jgi:hypothetical protein